MTVYSSKIIIFDTTAVISICYTLAFRINKVYYIASTKWTSFNFRNWRKDVDLERAAQPPVTNESIW